MSDIDVACEPASNGGWRCRVRVTESGRTSTFDVTARDAPSTDVERLVRETFVFLLEREPVTSILSSFDLAVVARYFPEYPAEILRRLERRP